MVPRIAKSGHSFKGAGLYYLHDKQAKTKDRVAWTQTHNLPTNDADKAFGWMAHTAMNANRLKYKAGVVPTGRKTTAGVVYSYSLAWHPEQTPDKQTMLDAAYETLNLLKLSDHEAVFVAHNDTAHPHVHIICNLIHPEHGKKAVPSYDRLIMSAWAEQLERNDGQILCEQRVINNEMRRNGKGLTQQFNIVKHRGATVGRKDVIQYHYDNAANIKDLQIALKKHGYTLAQGGRRGVVLVDENDKVFSLARQLKNQRAADIKNQLSGIKELPHVEDVLNPKPFDRDRYETERQKKIVDAAIEESKKQSQEEVKEEKSKQPEQKYHDSDLRRLDTLMAWEQKSQRMRYDLDDEQAKQYKKKELQDKITRLKHIISKHQYKWLKLPVVHNARLEQTQKELEDLNKNMANIEWRISEQKDALETRIQRSKPGSTDNRNSKDDYIKQIRERKNYSNTKDNDLDLEH